MTTRIGVPHEGMAWSVPPSVSPAYAASKHGVIGLTKAVVSPPPYPDWAAPE